MRGMEEMVGNAAAGAYVGLAEKTWSSMVARGHAPEPAKRKVVGAIAHPVWTVAQLDEWVANRPGRGSPGRPRIRRRTA